jgi:hypothetical protein
LGERKLPYLKKESRERIGRVQKISSLLGRAAENSYRSTTDREVLTF